MMSLPVGRQGSCGSLFAPDPWDGRTVAPYYLPVAREGVEDKKIK